MRLGSRKLPRLLHCTVGGLALLLAAPLSAQAPAQAAAQAPSASEAPASAELEELVGRIALYPDDLLSIVLPGATFPLQIVEADRWIEQNKGNKEAKPKESWDDSVKALINYPDVVTMMSNDLDWTSALGEAVAADQTAVMDAVQAFRRKAEGAGNLKTDDKQIVEVEEDVVKIVQADPQVIYVPTYEPQVVVVQQPAPVYPTYYPTPYPGLLLPVSAGLFVRCRLLLGRDGRVCVQLARRQHPQRHRHQRQPQHQHQQFDRDTNINNRPTNIDRGTSNQMAQQGRGSWQSGQSPSNVRQGRAPTATTRPANTGGGAQAGTRPSTGNAGGGAAANRPSTTPAQRPSGSTGSTAATRPQTSNTAANRSSTSSSGSRYNTTSRNASTARSSPPSRDAFSGQSSGRSVSAQSSRGGASRGGGGGARGGGGRR